MSSFWRPCSGNNIRVGEFQALENWRLFKHNFARCRCIREDFFYLILDTTWLGRIPVWDLDGSIALAVAMLYTIAAEVFTVVYIDAYQNLHLYKFHCRRNNALHGTAPRLFLFVSAKGWIAKVRTARSAWVLTVPPSSLGLLDEASYSLYSSFGVLLVAYSLMQLMRSWLNGLQTVRATKPEQELRP